MKISNETPLAIAPSPAKTYPDLWIYGVTVLAPTADSGRISIDLLPYNYETKEICPGAHHQTLVTSDLWAAVQEVPEVAQAMGAIFQAIVPLREWVAAKAKENEDARQAASLPLQTPDSSL